HIKCRRCGRRSYHVTKKRCSACGYGDSKVIKAYSWRVKTLNRARIR
ncbi:MAG TPA: 50S ribosomal protein L37e, partial [Candidatus Bathyarchaeia archaeon]|nr:50S ribosomal protein L37e [Candidatus Bathyarchaeia archaeon]